MGVCQKTPTIEGVGCTNFNPELNNFFFYFKGSVSKTPAGGGKGCTLLLLLKFDMPLPPHFLTSPSKNF